MSDSFNEEMEKCRRRDLEESDDETVHEVPMSATAQRKIEIFADYWNIDKEYVLSNLVVAKYLSTFGAIRNTAIRNKELDDEVIEKLKAGEITAEDLDEKYRKETVEVALDGEKKVYQIDDLPERFERFVENGRGE